MSRFDLSQPSLIKLANQEMYLRYILIDVDSTADIKNATSAFVIQKKLQQSVCNNSNYS